MPEADIFEAPAGEAFHAEPLLQSITEAFVGNGVLANGDAQVTADGATQMGINVAAASTGIRYAGTTYTPSSDSFTLSDGPTTTTGGVDDRRADIVYFDPSGPTYAVTEGTADPNPTPPSVPSGSLLLAVIAVDHEATDIGDGVILNWRARPVAVSGSEVNTADIADGAVTSAKIADGTIATVDLGDAVVTSAKIADGTIATADLSDGSVTSAKIVDGTIADADIDSATSIDRGKLDTQKTTAAITDTDSPYVTQDEEVVFVDPSSAAVTVTLASADAADGNPILIKDDAGAAGSSNAITVDTEGSETVDGASSATISTDYGWVEVTWNTRRSEWSVTSER